MEDAASQSVEGAGTVEEPPPPQTTFQDASASESLLESTADSGPSQKRPPPPPSPLTGCYLLVVIGEPHSERHKEIILQKISKGFLSWDVNECHVSLEKELQSITVQSPEGEEARYGERLIQYATENLVTEILIHPQLNTLHQCMKNLLSSFTKHRHIIHAGYTFAGNGSWILQDGTLSISDLVEALHEAEVLRVLKAYENSVTIDVHCAPEGDWTTERFQKEPVSKLCKIRINPGDVMTAGDPAISAFIRYLSPFLEPANIQQLLQPTDVVGNIRFTHPTLYVFPGGQGDAALFGINGFNMLVDGGFSRKACFWDFARHLDRLDAVLLTRLNNSTVNGISAVLQRKKMNHVYPQIGHFFCNLQDRKIALSPDGDKDKDSLIVNLAEEGQEIVANLKHLALKPHPCYRDGNQVDPVNLYHKVGHGKLDMYVISPARDSQAVKEFLSKWSANDNQLFSNTGKKVGGKGFDFPIQNLVSICALLVWQPANPNDTITRILFPGSTPQHKIFEGLDKLRHLEFLKHPVCSARSISPSASAVTVSRSVSKTRQPEDRFKSKPMENAQKSIIERKKAEIKTQIKAKPLKQKAENNKDSEESKLDGIKKIEDRMYEKDEKIENITKEIQKIRQESTVQRIETDQNEEEVEKQTKKVVHRSKYDMRNVKSKVDSRAPSKSIDRKKAPEKKTETGTSPPCTPKKTLVNGTASKPEKSRSLSRTNRSSPSATPGKSVKEANNRKVVEARVISRGTKAPTKAPPGPPPAPSVPPTLPVSAKTERKPISRRPKAVSPAKKPALSPVRALKTKSAPAKPEVDPVTKKIKGKVATELIKAVSAEVEPTIAGDDDKAEAEPVQVAQEAKTELGEMTEAEAADTHNLTENKETDEEAVKEVEVEVEAPKESETNIEIEIKEEAHDEEYLVVTKEEPVKIENREGEIENDSLQEDVGTKDETEGENEIKKIHQDEEDSEKKRKMMDVEEKAEESPRSPEKKEEDGKETEGQRLIDREEVVEVKEPVSKEQKEVESLPDEKFSTTVETSATTAPTLPEDEKAEELEKDDKEKEVEEELAVDEPPQEKHTKEEIKDEEEGDKEPRPEQPVLLAKTSAPAAPADTELPPQQKLQARDLVKTPDEVADLPVHEEVDPGMYSSGEFNRELQRKLEEAEPEGKVEESPNVDFKGAEKGEANILDEEEKEESEMKKLEDDMKETEKEAEKPEESAETLTNKYLDIIDQLEKSTSQEKPEDIPEKSTADVTTPKEGEPAHGEEVTAISVVPETLPEESTPLVVEEKVEQSAPITEKEEEEGREEAKDAENAEEKLPSHHESPVHREESPEKLTFQRLSMPEEVPSGSSTPEAPTSGKISPDQSGKTTPASAPKVEESAEEIATEKIATSGKATPDQSGKTTPASAPKFEESVEEVATEKVAASGKPTPEQSGKTTPENVEIAKEAPSDKTGITDTEVPIQSEKEQYAKDVPTERISPLSEELKVQPQLSGKSTPETEPKPSEKPVPDTRLTETEAADDRVTVPEEGESEEAILAIREEDRSDLHAEDGKSTPDTRLESEKVSPQGTLSGRQSPEDKQISGQITPVVCEARTATPALSGKASPSATPETSDGAPSGKATPSISGKESPQVSEKTPASGKSTPASLKESEKELRSTPTSSGKASPIPKEEEAPELSEKENFPHAEEKVKEASRVSTPAEKVSGAATPEIPGKDASSQETPISSEKDVSENITSVSGKESPVSDKDSLGRVTPDGVVLSYNGSPAKEERKPTLEKASSSDVEDTAKKSSLPASPPAAESPKITEQAKMIPERTSGKSTPLGAVKSSSVASSLPESPAPSSGMMSPAHSCDRRDDSGSGRLSVSGKSTPLDRVDGSLTNGIAGMDEELEKGTLESERQEKESQLTDDISSGEEEELKALEQGDDGDDSESESITRERLQSLTHTDTAPGSASSSPRKKRGSGVGSTPVEHITQESAQSSPKGKKDDINNLVKSVGDSDNHAAVKRMLVTTSSEDGGMEIEICPQGSIRLSKADTPVERETSFESSDEDKKEEEFGSLISRARKEYNLQRSRKSSTNTAEQDTSDEHEMDDECVEPEEFGSLIARAQKEYNLQRSRKSSRNSPENEEEETQLPTVSSPSVSRTESSRVDENDPTIMMTTILTEEREEQEEGGVKVTKEKEGPVDAEEEERESEKKLEEEMAKKEESTGSKETSLCSTISQEDLVSRKDSSARLDELRSSSVEMSPLKTTYITSDSGDAETLATSSFYAGEEEVLEYRREKGYESFTEIGPDGEKTEKTYFYTTDPDIAVSSGAFLKGIPEPIPEAPEMTFETFPTRDSFLPDDFAKAVDEHKSARGEYLGHPPAGKQDDPEEAPEKDVLEGWGKPLGLPLPPKNVRNAAILAGQNISTTSSLSTPSDNSDSISNWGHPMSLPSPVPPSTQNGTADPKETPKKEKKTVQAKKNDNKNSGNNTPSRRSESPVKQPERRAASAGRNKSSSNSFLYLDLTYVPHHGNSYYSNVEFFKRVRARYYVFSGTEPSKEVYNALLEAKQTWEDKDLEVTIIPTYDTDILGYWVAENEEILAKNKIDLSPSASRCTINLQDHETSCSAYRLEF